MRRITHISRGIRVAMISLALVLLAAAAPLVAAASNGGGSGP